MNDLENQLHRYADQVEAAVDDVAVPEAPTVQIFRAPLSPQRSPLLLVAAAVVLVVIGVGSLVLSTDDPEISVANGPDMAGSSANSDAEDADSAAVDVPDVLGLDIDSARAVLLEAGLDLSATFEPRADVGINQVFDQSPAAAEPVEPGTVVGLRVSSGIDQIMPDVLGMARLDAIERLEELGYTVKVSIEPSSSEPGLVIRQSPEPGTVPRPPTTVPLQEEIVEIVVAVADTGADASTVTVSPVENVFADIAITTLQNQGLDVVILFETVTPGSLGVGRVLSQSPAAFDEVEVGTTITITVGEVTAEPESGTPTTSMP